MESVRAVTAVVLEPELAGESPAGWNWGLVAALLCCVVFWALTVAALVAAL